MKSNGEVLWDASSDGFLWQHIGADKQADFERRAAAVVEAHVAADSQRMESMERALREIEQWAHAYPISAYPEPDLAKAAQVLSAAKMTLDAITASNMRHVVSRVHAIARAGLANGDEPSGTSADAPLLSEAVDLRLEFEQYRSTQPDADYARWLESKLANVRRSAKGSWTKPYGDLAENGLVHYVRLAPEFMDTEAAGEPHGIAIGGDVFDTEEEAYALAQRIDRFMVQMMLGLESAD